MNEDLDRLYVRKDSAEWRDVMHATRKLAALETKVDEATQSSWRTERYLVGGLDDKGKYTVGMAAWIKVLTALVSAFIIIWPLLVHYKIIQ